MCVVRHVTDVVTLFILEHFFGIDLSSHVLKSNNAISTTFLSCILLHGISITIWYDELVNIHLKVPIDIYNFLWGSNGANDEKLNRM